PMDYPDPTTGDFACRNIPSEEDALMKPRHLAEEVVLYYTNLTADNVELLLFDWGRHYSGKGVTCWTHFDTEQSSSESHYEDFENDRTGWFSIYLITPGGGISP